MTDKEKEEARFLMESDGVTCDKRIENARAHIEEVCRELKKEGKDHGDQNRQ